MARRSFRRFLISADAIEIHILCLGVVVLMSFAIAEGNGRQDEKIFLLLGVVFWPVLLGLRWLQSRHARKSAIDYAINSATKPNETLRQRIRGRRVVLLALAITGNLLIYSGNQGWQVNGLPARCLGYVLFGFAIVGAAGVNIWYGGPLDPRIDPEPVVDEHLDENARGDDEAV